MNRNIGLSIVFSVITCGIYSIYWFVVLTDELNIANEQKDQTSGIICILLSVVTCGIYGIYWAYRIGEKTDLLKANQGIMTDHNSNILYMILQIFGLNIIVLALCQNEMNKIYPVA
ncbi:MAG: DUF4234 domain-containing protein [Anaerovoracaceae bacterium]